MLRDNYMQVVEAVSDIEELVRHVDETMLFAMGECKSGAYKNTVLAHQMYHLLGVLHECMLNALAKLDEAGTMVVILKQAQMGTGMGKMGANSQ